MDEGLAVQRVQPAPGGAPGFGEWQPSLGFMIASHKDDLLAWEAGKSSGTLGFGQVAVLVKVGVNGIANEGDNLRFVSLHRFFQAFIKHAQLVQIRDGENSRRGHLVS
jgi:hypothetical protein